MAHNNTNAGGEINMLDPAGRIATDSDRPQRLITGQDVLVAPDRACCESAGEQLRPMRDAYKRAGEKASPG